MQHQTQDGKSRESCETISNREGLVNANLMKTAEGFPLRLSVVYVMRERAVMPQGTIRKLVMDRGFGFIQGAKGDLFFHHSQVEDNKFEDLQVGQTVDYNEGRGPKGPRAESVKSV